MERKIKKTENGINIIPQYIYNNVGGVDVMLSKEKFAEVDSELGHLSFYQDYIGDSKENENSFQLQLRMFKSLTPTSRPKSVIASLSLSDSEIMELANFVIEMREKYGTVSKFEKELTR